MLDIMKFVFENPWHYFGTLVLMMVAEIIIINFVTLLRGKSHG